MERSMLGLSGYCLISAGKTTLIFGEGGGGGSFTFAWEISTSLQQMSTQIRN